MGGAVASLAFAMALVVPLTLLRAWVITILWGWYAVRLGLPPISMAWAVGLCALTSAFMRTYPPKAEETKDPFKAIGNLFSKFGDSIGYSLLCLLLGWIALQWMPLP